MSITAAAEDLLHRSGPLKAGLVAFGQSQRFAGEFRSVYADRFGTAKAGRVFARLLGKPRFTWQRDGEALLRRYKAGYFDQTHHPASPR